MSYIELHASSAFSFLAGASQPEALIERAAELDMPGLALADRNGVYGAARFHTQAKKTGVRAHIGAEIAVSSFGNRLAPPAWLPHQCPAEPPRLLLLCASQTGYKNLCQLITRFKMREATKAVGAATLEDLEEFSAGLICLTGGNEGPLAAALASKGNSEARKLTDRLASIYGRGNLYLELQRHGQREEECRNQSLLTLASSLNLPVIATNGVQYATEKDREILDVLTTIRHHTSLDKAGRLLTLNNARSLCPAQHMAALFSDIPEAIANTRIVSDRLEFTLDNLGYEFPHYPTPENETMDSFLAKRVEEGVRKRYGSPAKRSLLDKARAQVAHELKLIAKLGFAGYFLIVWDLIRYCQQHGILAQGRGSAANSAVCYALEITAVDPVGMELLFERFLNENRGEWPDIDIDLPSGDQREQVIQYVYERYGQLGAAMTANVISYRGRSAAREVGKSLGFTEDQLARLSGLVGHWEWRGENDTLARHFEQAGFDARHPRIARYLDLCMRMQNLPRHLGQHSGGMVICAGMLSHVVPLERASMPGRSVIQWDKEDCADMGLIKVDLLGLGMMAVLQDCIELIPRHYKKEIDLATLPEDPLVYETLCKADTVGMFQVESRAQMASIPHNAPIRFYDLVVQVAIIRPGPIVGKMMHPYMRRRQGKEEVTYPHPSLEPVLKRTLGVPLFQEQLLRMAMTVASFTGAEAEELRRAVGMRRSMQRMKDLEGRLRDGMTRNGIGPEAQDNIVQGISSFAMYGFPESHAASFALIAYASAYLKVHYLAAFTCGLLNNQPMGFYSPAVLIKDAQRHGLRVRPIDIQRSDWLCTLEQVTEKSNFLSVDISRVDVLNGHDFSRAAIETNEAGALAAEGMHIESSAFLRGLKPRIQSSSSFDTTEVVPFQSKNRENSNDLHTTPGIQPRISHCLRIGLNYVKGLRQSSAEAILAARNQHGPFKNVDELAARVPQLNRKELVALARVGALNSLGAVEHRRDALWQVEQTGRPVGPLLRSAAPAGSNANPLKQMTADERIAADYAGTGVTTGPHPMAWQRAALQKQGFLSARDLENSRTERRVRIAGRVICRQRPGTAKGFVFLSLEDETGIANIIVAPDVFEQNRLIVTRSRFLSIAGKMQNQDGVTHVKAQQMEPFELSMNDGNHDLGRMWH
jgi:error-prone DNA polymerase